MPDRWNGERWVQEPTACAAGSGDNPWAKECAPTAATTGEADLATRDRAPPGFRADPSAAAFPAASGEPTGDDDSSKFTLAVCTLALRTDEISWSLRQKREICDDECRLRWEFDKAAISQAHLVTGAELGPALLPPGTVTVSDDTLQRQIRSWNPGPHTGGSPFRNRPPPGGTQFACRKVLGSPASEVSSAEACHCAVLFDEDTFEEDITVFLCTSPLAILRVGRFEWLVARARFRRPTEDGIRHFTFMSVHINNKCAG